MTEENKKPILTIGIPTYNRAFYLDKCLNWLCDYVGNDNNIEILVSDNHSTDNTEEIVEKYKSKYSNLVYYKQSENVGFDKNVKTLLDLGKGEYIKLHGDDDFFNKGTIYTVINRVVENPDVSLFFVHWGLNLPVVKGTGYNTYIRSLIGSNGISFITAMIIRNTAYKEIENKNKYLDSKIYKVYIQMDILKNNPNYYLLGGPIVSKLSGAARRFGYNLGDVFIGSYFDLLQDYEKYGLDNQVIKEQKDHVFNAIILPLTIKGPF